MQTHGWNRAISVEAQRCFGATASPDRFVRVAEHYGEAKLRVTQQGGVVGSAGRFAVQVAGHAVINRRETYVNHMWVSNLTSTLQTGQQSRDCTRSRAFWQKCAMVGFLQRTHATPQPSRLPAKARRNHVGLRDSRFVTRCVTSTVWRNSQAAARR